MRVSFIVLNWGDEEATRECVRSIRALRGGHDLEVIVVDNASTPASRARLAGAGHTHLVANRRNRGFAGGVNSGLRVASGELVALVNNDALLHPDWLVQGLAALAAPDVAVAGGKEFFLDDDNPAWDEGNRFHGAPLVDPARGFVLTTELDPPGGADVAYVSGCNLLARADAVREAGGLDERFFAYYEETDLCARLMASEWRVRYEPRMKVWHRRNLSSDRIPFRKRYLPARNQLILVAKHFPRGRWLHVVVALILQDLWFAAYGRQEGLRRRTGAPRLPGVARRAHLAAGLWGLTHLPHLALARRRTVRAGQHDERYRARLLAQPHLRPAG